MDNKSESTKLSRSTKGWYIAATCCWTFGFLVAMISKPMLKAYFAGYGVKLPEMTVLAIQVLDDPFPPTLLFAVVIILMTIGWLVGDDRVVGLYKLVFIASILLMLGYTFAMCMPYVKIYLEQRPAGN